MGQDLVWRPCRVRGKHSLPALVVPALAKGARTGHPFCDDVGDDKAGPPVLVSRGKFPYTVGPVIFSKSRLPT